MSRRRRENNRIDEGRGGKTIQLSRRRRENNRIEEEEEEEERKQ